MGMFDYVQHEAPCYNCGEILAVWQSKSGDCWLDTLTTDEVTNFYTSCDECGAWNEYNAIMPTPRSFERVIQPEEERSPHPRTLEDAEAEYQSTTSYLESRETKGGDG